MQLCTQVYGCQGSELTFTQHVLLHSQSLIFPTLKIQEIPDLIEAYRYLGRRKFRQAVREWVKEQNP